MNGIAKIQDGKSLTNRFDPEDISGLYKLAQTVASSGLSPDSVDTPEDAMVIMMTGAELGLTTMQALRTIHVVKGKPMLSADLLLALAQQSPLCEKFEIIEWTDQKCTMSTTRVGHDPQDFTFTIADAKKAGLVDRGRGKSNWQKYPKQMLRARAVSTLAKAVYPEVMTGLYTKSEADEIGEASIVDDGESGTTADAPTTDELNEKFSDDTDDPTNDAVDVEFEDADDAGDDDVDRETQNRRLGQLVATTDDLDNDDKRWIADAIADQCHEDDIGDVGAKPLKLVVDLLYKQGSTPEDGEMSGRRQMLEEWRGDGEDGGEGGDSEYVV